MWLAEERIGAKLALLGGLAALCLLLYLAHYPTFPNTTRLTALDVWQAGVLALLAGPAFVQVPQLYYTPPTPLPEPGD